jgi:hypothetical protein
MTRGIAPSQAQGTVTLGELCGAAGSSDGPSPRGGELAMTSNVPVERRRARRVRPKGSVRIKIEGREIHGRIVDVSESGIRLGVPEDDVCAEHVGSPTSIEVRLDTRIAAWLRLEGHVMRIGFRSIVLGLEHVPTAFHDLMSDELVASNNQVRTPCVVIVDHEAPRRAPFVDAFRGAGYEVVEATSPLEAVVRVGESGYEPHVIVVADTLPASVADELREFMTREHPGVQIVTIGHNSLDPMGRGDWLASQDPAHDLRARVEHLLANRRT